MVSVLFFLFGLAMNFSASGQTLTWGGDHIELQVTPEGVRVEFDCARGTIDGRLPAKNGTFALKGTFTPEPRGPVRDDAPAAVKAKYSGAIKGDTMTLRVAVEGDEEPGQDYTLTRNRSGNLRKCR